MLGHVLGLGVPTCLSEHSLLRTVLGSCPSVISPAPPDSDSGRGCQERRVAYPGSRSWWVEEPGLGRVAEPPSEVPPSPPPLCWPKLLPLLYDACNQSLLGERFFCHAGPMSQGLDGKPETGRQGQEGGCSLREAQEADSFVKGRSYFFAGQCCGAQGSQGS